MAGKTGTTAIEPTIFLTGINPSEVAQKYANDYYKTAKMPETKVGDSAKPITMQQALTEDISNAMFIVRLRNNTHQVIATTNNELDGSESQKRVCQWCFEEVETPLGIPFRMFETDDETIFYLDSCTCSNECSLSLEIANRKSHAFSQDPLYSTSEQILRYMHSKMFPDEPHLRPAPDPRLLKRNGGSINREQFKKHQFVRTANVRLASGRVEYLQS